MVRSSLPEDVVCIAIFGRVEVEEFVGYKATYGHRIVCWCGPCGLPIGGVEYGLQNVGSIRFNEHRLHCYYE